MKIERFSLGRILTFLIFGPYLVFGQTQNTYHGFRIGMALSETFAVGGGDLAKAQAACANPPGQLSSQEREVLAKVCAKMERTLSGQPTEWEFPKEQLRIAFDKGGIVRVSDFDGVVHLEGQSQVTNSVPTSAPAVMAAAPTPQPPSTQPKVKAGMMTGKVTQIGTTRARDISSREVSVQAVAISIDDPTNLNPYARNETYIVTAQAFGSRKTHVSFNVGDTIQFVRVGETRTGYGMLQILYVDEKGREKQELHGILNMR